MLALQEQLRQTYQLSHDQIFQVTTRGIAVSVKLQNDIVLSVIKEKKNNLSSTISCIIKITNWLLKNKIRGLYDQHWLLYIRIISNDETVPMLIANVHLWHITFRKP